jgi:hypothetical protein
MSQRQGDVNLQAAFENAAIRAALCICLPSEAAIALAKLAVVGGVAVAICYTCGKIFGPEQYRRVRQVRRQ